MRAHTMSLWVSALLLGCTSSPFPAAPAASRPAAAAKAARPLPAYPQIVPAPARPGFRVCAGCGGTTPTPKTLAGRARSGAPVPQAVEPVTVRYAASIPFAFNSSRLDAAGLAALDAFVARMPQGLHAQLLSVAGRTDSTGPVAANTRIARARAEAVLTALRPRLQPQAEDVRSEPLCCYIASNATAAGRADNRRVDVVAIVAIE